MVDAGKRASEEKQSSKAPSLLRPTAHLESWKARAILDNKRTFIYLLTPTLNSIINRGSGFDNAPIMIRISHFAFLLPVHDGQSITESRRLEDLRKT